MSGYELGTFEAVYVKDQSSVGRILTDEEALNWDHEGLGEVKFIPTGDCPGLMLYLDGGTLINGAELSDLATLMSYVGSDDEEWIRIHYLVNFEDGDVCDLTPAQVQEFDIHIFFGTCFSELRKEAGEAIFKNYWPDLYESWKNIGLRGFAFEPHNFLGSNIWDDDELEYDGSKVLIVRPTSYFRNLSDN